MAAWRWCASRGVTPIVEVCGSPHHDDKKQASSAAGGVLNVCWSVQSVEFRFIVRLNNELCRINNCST
jgi:hypothetical protein